MSSLLRERLAAGRVARGVASSMASAALVERLGQGWDFVWLDAQHGEWSLASVCGGIRACALTGASSLVRVPGHEYGVLGPFADQAPDAIMVPMVDTAEQARGVVEGLRFPPAGNRSYGGRRVYDRFGPDYYLDPTDLFVVAQVESPRSVSSAEAILAVEGIDALFIGAADLRVRLGLPMTVEVAETPALRDAFAAVAAAAHRVGKVCGCVVTDAGVLRVALDLGMCLLAFGSDAGFIRGGSAAKLDELAGIGL